MRILTALNTKTLRRGLHMHDPEYTAKHVQVLQTQIERWAPNADFACLSDIEVPGVATIPYKYDWPGWWIKMALMDPSLPGDFLFLDLDTVIVGPMNDITAKATQLTLLRDFYRDGKKLKEGLGGGLMYLPDEGRRAVWDYWMEQPQLRMREYPRGDQFLFERFWLNEAKRWQDIVPGQVVSWKVHCQNGVPSDARIVCFHGKPRPWEVGQFLHLYR